VPACGKDRLKFLFAGTTTYARSHYTETFVPRLSFFLISNKEPHALDEAVTGS
jgi:hypothetical protein